LKSIITDTAAHFKKEQTDNNQALYLFSSSITP